MPEILFSNAKPASGAAKVIVCGDQFSAKSYDSFLTEDELKLLTAAIKRENFKSSGFLSVNTLSHTIICAGLPDSPSPVDFEKLGGNLYKHIQKFEKAFVFSKNLSAEDVYHIAFGLELGSYRFDKYKTKQKPESLPKLETVVFVGGQKLSPKAYAPYAALSNAVRYARDLINEPANNLTPEILAAEIKRLSYLGLKIEILDEKQMKSKGFNLALSVAQGSCNKPRVAVLLWQGKPKQKTFDLGLVGKGVTFDSGGISLKPSKGMADMKQDMAGAGAVIGAMKAAALQKLPINVAAVVGLVENMPSGSATRPGDIVTSMSGQTVEILNTDAEGRLVLADCLWYIQEKYGVRKVVDIATLTGAIIVALGSEMAGVLGNAQGFIDKLRQLGAEVDENLWQLPITPAYNKLMDSAVADMVNSSETREAGSVTAACFLQRFIQKDVIWAHLDIAGMDKESKGRPLTPKGASGFGVRLLNALMKRECV